MKFSLSPSYFYFLDPNIVLSKLRFTYLCAVQVYTSLQMKQTPRHSCPLIYYKLMLMKKHITYKDEISFGHQRRNS